MLAHLKRTKIISIEITQYTPKNFALNRDWLNFFWQPSAASIYMPPIFHMASFNRYTPKFSGVPQMLTCCQKAGLQIVPKWGDADFWPLKKAVFRCFFLLNKFFRPNSRLLPKACYTYMESLCITGQFKLSWDHFSASYEASEFGWQIALNFQQHLTRCD